MSETTFVKSRVMPYIPEICKGIDVGFGNDKIREDFIGADKEKPYTGGLNFKVDMVCDITVGLPCPDNSFDVVYSSHLIEDFIDTQKILKEFIRAGKDGGRLILVFPDQVKYEEDCKRRGTTTNPHHKVREMGITYMLEEIKKTGCLELVTSFEMPPYNCIVIADIRKTTSLTETTY